MAGGGWLATRPMSCHTSSPYLERGWNIVTVNYRKGEDTAPQAVDDVLAAYRVIIENLENSGQPLDRIVVSGPSAGGHLALILGLLRDQAGEHGQTPIPRAVVNWFGITDITSVAAYLDARDPGGNYVRRWAGSDAMLAQICERYSPVKLIGESVPAIITIHGTEDSIVPYAQAERLHSRLRGSHRLVPIEGGNHGGFADAQFARAYTEIFDFLDAH